MNKKNKKRCERGWSVFEPSGNMHYSSWCLILHCLLGLTCNQLCCCIDMCVSVYLRTRALPSMVPHFVFLPRILLPFTWYSWSLPTTAKGIISCWVHMCKHKHTHTKSLKCNQWIFFFQVMLWLFPLTRTRCWNWQAWLWWYPTFVIVMSIA